MGNILVALFAIIIDRYFGAFNFPKHPAVIIGELIDSFEESYYKDSFFRGFLLVSFVIGVISIFAFSISFYLGQFNIVVNTLFSSIIASFFIRHRRLSDFVTGVLRAENTQDRKETFCKFVKGDCDKLSEDTIYKTTIKTYAKHLNNDVIAPIFYLLLFGLPGIVLYKTISIITTMADTKEEKYRRYGEFASSLDKLLTFIPKYITATLITLVSRTKENLSLYEKAEIYKNPHSALSLAVTNKMIHLQFHLIKVLTIRNQIDLFIILALALVYFLLLLLAS
ncbi:MAG: cobalamin biosynthesis protein [Campylobacterota bacterium]|nr:cobalamin biosynthesis protein [Campylobacterota bacterium]